MTSLILSTAARLLLPLLLLFSVFVLLRGHNEPGGGFVGGLVAAAAFALYALAQGVGPARAALRANTQTVIAAGLLLAGASVTLPLLAGRPAMTGLWLAQELPIVGKVGTPFLFDVGVYLTVSGVTLRIILHMAEAEER
ncbi:MAG: Na+/H+ antiporter subunit B [Aggregatilineales bacterium]